MAGDESSVVGVDGDDEDGSEDKCNDDNDDDHGEW